MKKTLFLLAVLAAAAAGGAVWWRSRPTLAEKGRARLEAGDAAAAIATFHRALEKDLPPAVEESVRADLVRAYVVRGSIDGAEEELRALLEKFPDNSYGHLVSGFINMVKGYDNFAVESFEKARALDPGDLRAALGLAGLYAYRGEFEKAEAGYRDVLDKASDPAALAGLAQVHRIQGRLNDALAEYGRYLQQFPHDVRMRMAHIRTLLEAGRSADAENQASQLAQERGGEGAPKTLLGDVYAEVGRLEEAVGLYRDVLRENPADVFVAQRLAVWTARRGNVEEARALLERASQALPKPDSNSSFASLMEVQDALEFKSRVREAQVDQAVAVAEVDASAAMYPDAERELQRALQLYSLDLGALRGMADISRRKNDAEGRRKWVERAAALYPAHPAVLLDRAEVRLADRDLSSALSDVASVQGIAPSLPRAAAVRAEVLLAQKKFVEALAAAEEAVRLGPRDWTAHLASGIARHSAGQDAEAVTPLLKSLELNPFSARTHYALAAVYRALDRVKDADALAAEAARIEPLAFSRAPAKPSRRK